MEYVGPYPYIDADTGTVVEVPDFTEQLARMLDLPDASRATSSTITLPYSSSYTPVPGSLETSLTLTHRTLVSMRLHASVKGVTDVFHYLRFRATDGTVALSWSDNSEILLWRATAGTLGDRNTLELTQAFDPGTWTFGLDYKMASSATSATLSYPRLEAVPIRPARA